MKITKISKD